MDEMTRDLLDLFKQDANESVAGPDAALNHVRSTTPGAKAESDAKLIKRLQKMLRQAKAADSRWRKRAQECWEFYDNDQWTTADKESLRQRRQAPVVINRIAPTIDLVVGLQVTQPIDWVAKPVATGRRRRGPGDVGGAQVRGPPEQRFPHHH
jgi:hypothetical protein